MVAKTVEEEKRAARERSAARRRKARAPRKKSLPKSPESKAAQRRRLQILLYGITPDDYAAMHQAQGGRCAICNRAETDARKRLNTDHCHRTGRVRGLLCRDCNIGLGNFKDKTDLLLNAVAYLRAGTEKLLYQRLTI